MKKTCFLLAIIFTLCGIKVNALSVSAKYACVMDSVTGEVLFEKNAGEKHSMASTTKIMTALVALENGSTDDIVTVSKNAAGTEGSSIYLRVGEKIPLKDLLYGLMLASGNDAAVAIAEHIGGSIENFAEMMNEKAEKIGAKNTSFKNPNGLDADGHYTTAYDLALITRYALKNKDFAEIVSTKSKTLSNDGQQYGRVVTNHNKMLRTYNGCIGVKTGFTKKTGRCLVSAAERNNTAVVAVTLKAPDDWTDHTNMLNFAFSEYTSVPLVKKNMIVKTLPVKNGDCKSMELLANDDFYILLQKDRDLSNYKLDISVPKRLCAPVENGTVLGVIKICYKNEPVKEIEVVAGADAAYVEPEKLSFFENLKRIFMIKVNSLCFLSQK